MHINSDFVLTPAQQQIYDRDARFTIIKAGRRFGKTKYAVFWLFKKALEVENEQVWFLAPTHTQAKDIAWWELLHLIPDDLILSISRQYLEIELINHTRICLKSSDSDESLLGRRLYAIVMDEAAKQKSHVFDQIIRPMLVDLKGSAMIISTPEKSWFTALFREAASGNDKEWAAFHFTIYDNPHIDKAEVDKIKKTALHDVWEGQYMAREVDHVGQVYEEFSNHCIYSEDSTYKDMNKWPCVIGIDWGFSDNTAAIWLHVSPEGHVVASKEHFQSGWDVSRHCEVIKANSRGMNIHSYVLDISAFRTVESGGCIAEKFQREGILCQKSLKDFSSSLDVTKKFLRGLGGIPWLYISNRCPELINGFKSWEWKRHEPDTLAALRYGLEYIVRRKLSTLIEKPELFKFDATPFIQKLEFPISKADIRWNWDAGVPY